MPRTLAVLISANRSQCGRRSSVRRILWGGAVTVAIAWNISAVWAFQNEPTGFRGIAWGTPFAAVRNQMRWLKNDDGYVIYTRAGDKLQIGNAKLTSIIYKFYRGAFAKIELESAHKYKDALYSAFWGKFGTPEDGCPLGCIWDGAISFATVDCDVLGWETPCTASIESVMYEHKKKDDEAAAQHAKDLKDAASAKKDF